MSRFARHAPGSHSLGLEVWWGGLEAWEGSCGGKVAKEVREQEKRDRQRGREEQGKRERGTGKEGGVVYLREDVRTA